MKTVFIVDDDDDIRLIIEYMLQREGYAVTSARDGKEAMELISNNDTPDLALFDVMMPYADGFELLKFARKQGSWDATPIIMLTAKSQESDIVRALDNGASDYVVKPFKPNELLARIRRQLH